MKAEGAAADSGDTLFLVSHLLGNAVTWGSSFLLIKLVTDTLEPAQIAAMRAIGAALVLGLALLAFRHRLWPSGREARDWMVLGTVNGWLPNILVAFALARMDSGPAALIQAAGPLMTALLAHVFLAGERLTLARSLGIGVGLVGMALLIGLDALSGQTTAVAVAAMVLLTFGYAVGNIYARRIPNAQPIRLAFGQQISSALVAASLVAIVLGPGKLVPPAADVPVVLTLAIVCTALPIWIFMRLLARSGPTRASMTSYLVPAVAVILGIVVLGEPLALRQILGGFIVLFGVAIVTGLVRLPPRSPV